MSDDGLDVFLMWSGLVAWIVLIALVLIWCSNHVRFV